MPSLMLLPTSTAGIAYAKISGFLLAMLPAAVCFLLGCLITPRNAAELFGNLDVRGVLYVASIVLTFLHVSVFLSIHSRAGVLITFVLLIASIILFNILAFAVNRAAGISEAMVIGSLLVMWLTICVLHYRIGKSLQQNAAA